MRVPPWLLPAVAGVALFLAGRWTAPGASSRGGAADAGPTGGERAGAALAAPLGSPAGANAPAPTRSRLPDASAEAAAPRRPSASGRARPPRPPADLAGEPPPPDEGAPPDEAAEAWRVRADWLQVQAWGEPVPWDDAVPEHLLEPAFAEGFDEAMRACQPDAELLDLHCDEAPCVARLRVTGPGALRELTQQCPAWQDRFGRHTTYRQGKACGQPFVLLSPFDGPWADALGADGRANLRKRMEHRWDRLEANWACE